MQNYVCIQKKSFTYGACGPFTKNKERIETFMQTGNTDFIYRIELDKAYFPHEMAYGKSKDLTKRTQSDKVLKVKAFKIASDPKYDGYHTAINGLIFLIKSVMKVVLLLNQITNLKMNFTCRIIENLRDEKFIHPLKTMFGVFI